MTDDPEDDLQWLRYWVVLATVHMIELVIIIIIIILFLITIIIIVVVDVVIPVIIVVVLTNFQSSLDSRWFF